MVFPASRKKFRTARCPKLLLNVHMMTDLFTLVGIGKNRWGGGIGSQQRGIQNRPCLLFLRELKLLWKHKIFLLLLARNKLSIFYFRNIENHYMLYKVIIQPLSAVFVRKPLIFDIIQFAWFSLYHYKTIWHVLTGRIVRYGTLIY
jgi:hypothetical protein